MPTLSPTRKDDPAPHPFIKWAGGKRQLLAQLELLYPAASDARRYFEPFVGSGAVFFSVRGLLRPEKIALTDANEDLVNVYRVIRDDPERLIKALAHHTAMHSRAHFYDVRARSPRRRSAVSKAARLVYLNRTCFNGLYRVNSRGQFNVPIGRYTNPPILDARNLRAVSRALRSVELRAEHFRRILRHARGGDFIYFDPPYHPISPTSAFTSYSVNSGSSSFSASDQEELAEVYATLAARGCRVMLSNSDCAFIRSLYGTFDVRIVTARRSINSKPGKRGAISEVVVINYRPAQGRLPLGDRQGQPLADAGRSPSLAAPAGRTHAAD